MKAADLAVRPGELVGVLGANGAGKTTLLRAAMGLARLESGSAELGARDVRGLSERERAGYAAYLPQDRRVGWNMSAWRVASLGAPFAPAAVARTRALAALRRVGLGGLEDRGVLEMSGGERARVLLARLLVVDAPILVADEPIAGLDPDAQLLALDLFRDAADHGAAVLLTLHDLALAAQFCDRVVVLSEGVVVADGPSTSALRPDILASAFNLEGRLETSGASPILMVRRRRPQP